MTSSFPASFFLASCECPRFERWDSKIFTDIPSLSAYLVKEIKDMWTDEDQNDSDYLMALKAASADELCKTGGVVVIDFSELTLRVTVHTPQTLLAKVMEKLPELGHELH